MACFDAAGSPTDTLFDVVYLNSEDHPLLPGDGHGKYAYALADQSTAASYVPVHARFGRRAPGCARALAAPARAGILSGGERVGPARASRPQRRRIALGLRADRRELRAEPGGRDDVGHDL